MALIVINARFLTQNVTGVQRFAIEICKILKVKFSNDIVFLTPKNINQKELAEELGAQVIGNNCGHVWEQIELPMYLKKHGNPVLVNLCNTAPLFYKNKIVTIHDVGFEVFPNTYSKKFLFFYKWLIPKIISNSKKVLTVSNFSKDEIIKYYGTPAEKVEVVNNAVGSDFHEIKDETLSTQNYFLAVSSLNYRKNLPLVLKAFELFSKKHSDYKLYIIGDFDSKSFSSLNLDRYERIKGIEFKGRVSDQELIKYYSNAVAFIYPSFYEGFGIPPLEAQSCNCPVIVSAISCLPEIFDQSVLYCNPEDSDSLLVQMNTVKEESCRERLVNLGMNNTKKYDWQVSAEKVYKIIEKYS